MLSDRALAMTPFHRQKFVRRLEPERRSSSDAARFPAKRAARSGLE
jgi:hypothetical protein